MLELQAGVRRNEFAAMVTAGQTIRSRTSRITTVLSRPTWIPSLIFFATYIRLTQHLVWLEQADAAVVRADAGHYCSATSTWHPDLLCSTIGS